MGVGTPRNWFTTFSTVPCMTGLPLCQTMVLLSNDSSYSVFAVAVFSSFFAIFRSLLATAIWFMIVVFLYSLFSMFIIFRV